MISVCVYCNYNLVINDSNVTRLPACRMKMTDVFVQLAYILQFFLVADYATTFAHYGHLRQNVIRYTLRPTRVRTSRNLDPNLCLGRGRGLTLGPLTWQVIMCGIKSGMFRESQS